VRSYGASGDSDLPNTDSSACLTNIKALCAQQIKFSSSILFDHAKRNHMSCCED
jgi:hypothetical protein